MDNNYPYIDEKSVISDALYIHYVEKNEQFENNFVEKIIGKLGSKMDYKLLRYLLSKDINLECNIHDEKGFSICLADSLALSHTDSKKMGLIIDKLSILDRITYNDYNNGIYTNTFLMNIIAERLDDSLKAFSDNNFELHSVDNFYDNLSKALNIISNKKFDCDELKKFLFEILYSDKLKKFNIDNLSLLEDMLDSDSYNAFTSYLNKKAEEEVIVLYNLNKENCLVLRKD